MAPTTFAQDSTQTERNIQRLQSGVPGRTKLMLTGIAWAGMQADLNNPDEHAPKTNINDFGFSPLVLCKLSDKLLFEGELEIQASGDEENAAAFDLEYAKFSYLLGKSVTIGAGKMLSPFGAFGEKWEPVHVERFANAPLRPDDQFLPDDTHLYWGAVIGADIRGMIPMGSARMTYVGYVCNGPVLQLDPEMGGLTQEENLNDNNNNKEVGARLGLLPFANSSLEIGLSVKSAKVGGLQDSVYVIGEQYKSYKDVGSSAIALDWNYVKALAGIKSIIGLRGQWTQAKVDDAYYEVPEGFTPAAGGYAPGDSSLYTFDNSMQSYYVQFSFRPATVDNACLKNLEFLLRYNSLTAPKDAAWGPKDKNGNGASVTRFDVGVDYWLNWRTGLRLAYESTSLADGTNRNFFLVRLATGL
jgi:hypothetical protein